MRRVPARLSARLAGWRRRLAVATAAMFLFSAIFPTVAGFSHNTAAFPKWWGMVDVGAAFLLGMLVFVLLWLVNDRVSKSAIDASYRSYRVLLHGIFVLILVFFFLGDRIVWINCATGFAWRAWLLLYCLPSWFTAFEERDASVRMSS